MVMDLQDVSETLEDAVARSHIRLLGSSSKSLSLDPSSSRHTRVGVDPVSQGSDEEDGPDDCGNEESDHPASIERAMRCGYDRFGHKREKKDRRDQKCDRDDRSPGVGGSIERALPVEHRTHLVVALHGNSVLLASKGGRLLIDFSRYRPRHLRAD